MMLCDFAQVADGKLYISGGGWSVTGPGAFTAGIALKFDVPWDRTNNPITLALSLVGEDGHPVLHEGPVGPQPIQVHAQFEVGRPPGLKAGTALDVPLAINVGPFHLPPGERFVWNLTVNDESKADWHLGFTTRPSPASAEPTGPLQQ